MHLQLRDQQLKTISYIYRFISKLQSNCKQKSTNDTQTNKKNQLKYNSKDSHQTTRGENKEEGNKKDQQQQQKNQSN